MKRMIFRMQYTWTEFEQRLITHRDVKIDISRMLFKYETQIKEYIDKIQQLIFEEAAPLFDELYEIQDYLSVAKYKYHLELKEELNWFIYHFERGDENDVREYWYSRFCNGFIWPFNEGS